MSGFSPEWLALREPVDHRSRSGEIAQALAARFAARGEIDVVDLGCGTGSNLRGTAPALADTQHWVLVDYADDLLAAARQTLMRWADTAADERDALVLSKGGKQIRARFQRADLSRDLEDALGVKPDLVTASALFDLCSVNFIKGCARAVSERRAVFYTALTYNGIQRWTPRQPSDNAMVAAFHAHQMTDKGFGASAGPTAPAHLADAFRASGYSLLEGDSPWELGADDADLIRQLAAGFADAVSETGKLDSRTIDAWRRAPHTGAVVGHTDTLAIPV
jgi:SAM-dependent methyltransferase